MSISIVVAVLLGGVSAPAAAADATLSEIGGRPLATAPLAGWRMDFATGDVWSSPAVGDVTGDGRPEIVIGGLNSIARVYDLQGALIATLDPGGADFAARTGATHASPALGDLDGDGVNDVVISNTGSVMAAFSVRGGTVRQLIRVTEPRAFEAGPNGLFATPALGYVDGNAQLDVVTASWGQLVDAWSGTSGNRISGWPHWVKDTVWSSPAIGDVDGDGDSEIVVGGDCDGSGELQPCFGTAGGGYLWAFNLDGSLLWRHFVPNQVVWSSPALADLNGDGALDVVAGTGAYWPEPRGREVVAVNGRNGQRMWTASTDARVVGSPSIADVDGDGKPEVFVVSRGGRMHSFQGESGARRFAPLCIDDGPSCSDPNSATHGGVSLADIDNDGVIEAVVHAEQKLRVYDASTGRLESTVRSGYGRTLFASSGTPTIASVDGAAWIITLSLGDRNGNLQRDDQDELVLSAWTSGRPLGAAPWPTFKQNMMRTSAVAPAGGDTTSLDRFVSSVYRDFLSREASSGERADAVGRLSRGTMSRYNLATELSRSDEWITTVITAFYRDTLGREPDSAGLRGWINAARNGMPVAQIAAAFYSSPEYYSTVGRNDPRTWVSDLYRKLLLREGDAGGVNTWVDALGRGMPRDVVSFGFYQSPEKLGVRIDALYGELLGRDPEPGAVANWSPFVSNQGDLVLAAALAASTEYLSRAQTQG
ncbi:DUF4214 domain-containing protein [Microcella daejeonensis]|uniref:DUF4214 domain-containing protein n=1 Tax=Microcella daejeonensis TaxID=2994971 RepID=UPI00226E40E0|nr:DUF4214 domain-containing protein [Microcella daejeonensis]WAB84037.1 DUF4214 domain-containing protein [Microcella daejeonensis]